MLVQVYPDFFYASLIITKIETAHIGDQRIMQYYVPNTMSYFEQAFHC